MAKISKPTINRKGVPPPETETSINLVRIPDQDLVPLNFKVPAEFKREFKSHAAQLDTSMVQLLMECFVVYKNTK